MATQRPVILDNENELSKLLTGDTLEPSALGTGTPTGTKFLRDDGSWQTVEGGGGTAATPLELVSPYVVDYYMPSELAELVITTPAITLNLNHVALSVLLSSHSWTIVEGQKIILSMHQGYATPDGTALRQYSGIYVVGSTTNPAAVPLTRDPDFSEWFPGAEIQARRIIGEHRMCLLYAENFDASTNRVSLPSLFAEEAFIVPASPGLLYFRRHLTGAGGSDGVLPAPLAENTRYSMYDTYDEGELHWEKYEQTRRVAISTNHADPSTGHVDFTNTGTASSAGYVARAIVFVSREIYGEQSPVRIELVDPAGSVTTPQASWATVVFKHNFGANRSNGRAESDSEAAWNTVQSLNMSRVEYAGGPHNNGQGASYAAPNYALALGRSSAATADGSLAIGYGAVASAERSVAIGNGAQARHSNTVVLGGTDYPNRSTQQGQFVSLGWNGGEEIASQGRLNVSLFGISNSYVGASSIGPFIPQKPEFCLFKGRIFCSLGNHDSGTQFRPRGAVFEIEGHVGWYSPTVTSSFRVRKVAGDPVWGGVPRITGVRFIDSATLPGVREMYIDVAQDVDVSGASAESCSWVAEISFYEEDASGWNMRTLNQVVWFDATPGPRVQASENLVAGQLVNLWNSGGARVRKADASLGRPADGFILDYATSGQDVVVYLLGENPFLSGMSAGRLWLGEDGSVSNTPAVAGVVQEVGFALTSTSMTFQRGTPVAT